MNEVTQQPMTPGFGVAGLVICPFLKGPCQKSACEMWVEFTYSENKVARCAVAWQPIINVELRQEIERTRLLLSQVIKSEVKDAAS